MYEQVRILASSLICKIRLDTHEYYIFIRIVYHIDICTCTQQYVHIYQID